MEPALTKVVALVVVVLVASAARADCPADMVAVPAATRTLGAGDDGPPATRPEHRVTTRAFCLERTEVTVTAYAACVHAGGCTPASEPPQSLEEDRYLARQCNANANRPKHPINCVAWNQADAYCRWAKRRLPTEAEWEAAARSVDGRRYPWGNDPPSKLRVNACGGECKKLGARSGYAWGTLYDEDDGWEGTAKVGSFERGASAAGALDLAGNVAEWVADWLGPYPREPVEDPSGPANGQYKVVRGGSWFSGDRSRVDARDRGWAAPGDRDPTIGFRCAL